MKPRKLDIFSSKRTKHILETFIIFNMAVLIYLIQFIDKLRNSMSAT